MTLKNRILDQIADRGPLPFEEFMELALYHPLGFFGGGEMRSVKAGDFLTSPGVSRLFGESLAGYVRSEWERIGDPFTFVEVGAGSGSLLRALLGKVDMEVRAVEKSPAARETLAGLISPDRVLTSLSEVPGPLRGVVIANELLDNIPMAIAQNTDSGWRERWVGADGGSLVFVDAPPRPEVVEWLDSHAGPVDVGGWVEVQIGAGIWLQEAMALLEAGSILLVDYGDTKEGLAPRRQDGTLRTYRAHHLGPHPLDEPGATDITADVNFSALTHLAAQDDRFEVTLMRQDDFLTELGLRERLSALRRDELAHAADPDQTERLALRSLKTEAETLLHPRGLGDFRVLRLATVGNHAGSG